MPPSKDNKSKRKSESVDFGFSFALGGFSQLQGDALNRALADYKTKIMDSVTAKSGDLTNQSIDVQQGFTAEAHHVGAFNIEAAARGELNHTATSLLPSMKESQHTKQELKGAVQVHFLLEMQGLRWDGGVVVPRLMPEHCDHATAAHRRGVRCSRRG